MAADRGRFGAEYETKDGKTHREHRETAKEAGELVDNFRSGKGGTDIVSAKFIEEDD